MQMANAIIKNIPIGLVGLLSFISIFLHYD